MSTTTDEKLRSVQSSNDHLSHCMLCEHRCGANRIAGERGPCKADGVARVFRHRVEFGEELELVPSHIFYLSGCDMRCVFCIAEENAFDAGLGEPLTADFLRSALADGKANGARNIQWLGGEANIHLPRILACMSECSDLPPVVWKSNFYMTPEVFDLLNGWVRTYVADFKFGNDDCALRLGGVERYVSVVTRNLMFARNQADLIVRHLVMPGHEDCCTGPVIDWMARRLPEAKFSLRGGYLPAWRARRMAGLDRYLSPPEFQSVVARAKSAGLRLVD